MMKNIAFAIWMVGYSFNMSWDSNNWHNRPDWAGVPTSAQFLAILIGLFIWIFIGCLLYEPRTK